MLLSDILEQLSIGELSQLAIGGYSSGIGIEECNYGKIIPHINLALSELYSRFPINMEQLRIEQQEGVNEYYLDPKFAQSNETSVEPIKYIQDLPPAKPFVTSPLRIEAIFNHEGKETRYTEDDGSYVQELSATDQDNYWMAFTPSFNSIYLPYPEPGVPVYVTYRSAPEKIKVIGVVPHKTEIPLPMTLLAPLLSFVASRVFSNLNSDNSLNEGQYYYKKFEAACAKLVKEDVFNTYNKLNDKLDTNGWV